MKKQEGKKKGGSAKYGRNKRGIVDTALSKYVRGIIEFDRYLKLSKTQ
jgi:hypothetical protein